jgi:chromate transport protein ChrA
MASIFGFAVVVSLVIVIYVIFWTLFSKNRNRIDYPFVRVEWIAWLFIASYGLSQDSFMGWVLLVAALVCSVITFIKYQQFLDFKSSKKTDKDQLAK